MFGKTLTKAVVLAVVAGSLAAGTASAHHSFASYDMSKTQTMSGTLKEFRWGAPHSSMVLTYVKGGKTADMSLVSGSPLMFSRAGFAPRDFKRGDKVTVVYHPNVNGLPGGALSKLTLPDGRTYSDTEANNAAPAAAPAR
jgi:hypothetical protein